MEYTYIIEGSEIHDKDSLFEQFCMNMTDDLGFETGHTLDALADILRGGFGMHEYGEQISILWEDFEMSRKALGDEYMMKVLKILLREDPEYDVILKIA